MIEIIVGICEVKIYVWEWFFRDYVKEVWRLVERIKLNGKFLSSVLL